MNITFWGAAQEVTGSKHLISVNGKNVLLDAGFFQGHRAEAEEKNRNLPFLGSEIDAIVLSHAHMDHCGSIPTLYKTGFRGKIYATPATCDVAQIMLEDSADIQMSDASYINRYKKPSEYIEPLYAQADVAAVMHHFEAKRLREGFEPVPGMRVEFMEAGHILGSAQVHITLTEGERTVRLGFTGDLGRKGLPILRDPEFFDSLDYLVSESTYGNRFHESTDDLEEKLQKVILETLERKGKIIAPAFALGRTQSLIYLLHKLTDQKNIPRIPIFIDSPMATEVTEVFSKHKELYDDELIAFLGNDDDPMSFRNLHFTQSAEDSKSLNHREGPFIVISTSGMCEVGRIRHHLKNSVEQPNNTILVTGFMAEHTLGRRIVERQSKIKLFDTMYPLRARVAVMDALSAHAGQPELLAHIKPITGLRNIFLVHGEPDAQRVMMEKIKSFNQSAAIHNPAFGQSFEL